MVYTVMIVDDDKMVLNGLEKIIDWNAHGFEVSAKVLNGKDAFELQRQKHYDLIITDLKMPMLDGVGLIRKLYEIHDTTPVIVLSAYGEFEYAQEVMKYGVQYYMLKPVDEIVLCGYLSRIVEKLSQGTTVQENVIDSKHFEHQYRISAYGTIPEVRRYINNHLTEQLSLNLLAGIYGFSPVYLGRLFKKETSMSFNDYLRKCRVDKACDLLKNTDDTISDIAIHVGYSDVGYFYKCFKAVTGKAPTDFRNEITK